MAIVYKQRERERERQREREGERERDKEREKERERESQEEGEIGESEGEANLTILAVATHWPVRGSPVLMDIGVALTPVFFMINCATCAWT